MSGAQTSPIGDEARRRAERRVGARLGFLSHLLLFALVNLALATVNALATPSFWWFPWPLLGWGIALAVHAVNVFALEGWREAWVRREEERELRRLQGR
ncbi:MAG: 2TM domain-containing protein [Chloroflexi bacterium]|nr:2TM domain-containing protein [Chloroflexota bacterium]